MVFLSLCLCFFLFTFLNVSESSYCGRTPMTLETDYLSYCDNRIGDADTCNSAWNAFSSSFDMKDPENVSPSDYQGYFSVLPITSSPDESLFWSGTHELVGLVSCMCYSSGMPLVSSLTTPSSAIINDMGNINWCGSTEGIDYDNPCLCDVTSNFWSQFSIEFALAAEGTVFYLTNGNRDSGAFSSTSFFAIHEIPNLVYPRVTGVVVLDIHTKGEGEACGKGTLNDLQDILENKSFQYTCYNVYGDVNNDNHSALTDCLSHIIRAAQEGSKPTPDDCFDSARNDLTAPLLCILIVTISLILFLM